MEPVYQGYCDIFYITKTLQKALKKVIKKGVDHPYLYDQLFVCWSTATNSKYGSKPSLSAYFGGTEVIPKIPEFYAKPENFLELCKDIENNILVRLPNHSQVVQEIFEALDSDDHLIDDKRSEYFKLREHYFSEDQKFTPPDFPREALLNWESHLLADMILFVMTDPIFLRKSTKDHTPVMRQDYYPEPEGWYNLVPDPYFPFYGRTEELTQLQELFQQHKHIFLTGVPGNGKSELAKNFAAMYRKHRCQTYYLFYTGNLRSDIIHMLNTSSLSLVPAYASAPNQLAIISEKVDAAPQDLFTRCLNILRNLSPDDLIVVDNFDVLPEGIQQSASDQSEEAAFCKEPLLAELLSLRCKLLISTRCNFQQMQLSLPFHCMEVKELDTPSLMKLFAYYYPDAEDHVRISKGIIRAAFRNTLLVKMTAKLLRESFWAPEDVLKELKNDLSVNGIRDTVTCEIDGQLYSQTISSHIDTLLKLFRLTDSQMDILRNMCLMPLSGVSREVFRKMTGLTDAKDLQQLIYMGFIQRNKKNTLSMHPLLKEAILSKTKPDYANCSLLLKNLNQVCRNQIGQQSDFCKEVSKIIESLVPCLGADLSQRENLRGYFHFIQDAIPYQYFFSRMDSVQLLISLLDKLLNLSDFNSPIDQLIQNATRIMMEDDHKEDSHQKLERMLSIVNSVPMIFIDYHFMETILRGMITCMTEVKGERMYAVLNNILSTVSYHASSKLVRLFCYPISIYISQKEMARHTLQLPAHEEADWGADELETQVQLLLSSPSAEENTR